MSQEEARGLYDGTTEAPVFFSCTSGDIGGAFILRMEVKLSVQIAAPEDKMACVIDKQKDWTPKVQNSPRLVRNSYMTSFFKVRGK